MKNRFTGAVLTALLMAPSVIPTGLFAQATPPGLMNYQGVLRDASGNPVSNGNYDMAFSFYSVLAGGTVLLTDSHLASGSGAVTVSGGLFTVALGSGTITPGADSTLPAVFTNHASVYLAVKVGADADMAPRIHVISAPFAQNAHSVDGAVAGPSGNVLSSNGSSWTSAPPSAGAGGGVVDAANTTLTRFGSGTGADPFKLALNLANSNIWGGAQTFNANTLFPGSGIWNTSGHVGIGITTPSWPLVIRTSQAVAQFDSTNGASASVLELRNSGASPPLLGAINFNNAANSYPGQIAYSGTDTMTFRTAGVDRMRIDSNGNVGLGTTPILGERLRVLSSASGLAVVGTGDTGIEAYGNTAGGYFRDLDNGGDGYVGYSIYSFYGTGAKAFVQNHPTEKDRVIVYAALEGDEVAIYTRGTAKLVKGEARVKLGETFQWVTNPDIGLTAHLTPKGDCNGLFADSVSTTEIVVKELNGGKSNTAFDYIVYGLRIGFEEASIVQEKQRESYIPSFKDHRERYARYPELRAFNSLERFKSMENAAGLRASFDFSASKALHDAIHEYDPATDPPVDNLFGFGHGSNLPETAHGSMPSAGSTPPPSSAPPAVALQKVVPTAQESPALADATATAQPPLSTAAPRFPLSEPVEAGDVLVMDPHREGMLMPCRQAADPMLVGVAMEASSENVPVTVSGIVLIKVDASYAPVHRGDLLTTSPTLGHAMRAVDSTAGTILGKALEDLDSGTGLIKVLAMLR